MKKIYIILALSLSIVSIAYSSSKTLQKRASFAYEELENINNDSKNNQQTTQSVNVEDEMQSKPIIMILPEVQAKGAASLQQVADNPFAKATMEGITDYLAQKHYEVKSLEGSTDLENIIQMQNDIAGNSEDLAYLAGLTLDADIFIKYSGFIDNNGFVTVNIKAYETTTAKLLASKSSSIDSHGRLSPIDKQANLKSAAKKAMPSIEKQLAAYWKDDVKLGVQYKVIMNITGEYSDSELENLQDEIPQNLKQKFNKVKVNSMTSKTIDLVVYADQQKFDGVNDVYREIRVSLKNLVETKKLNITKKLIVMEIK